MGPAWVWCALVVVAFLPEAATSGQRHAPSLFLRDGLAFFISDRLSVFDLGNHPHTTRLPQDLQLPGPAGKLVLAESTGYFTAYSSATNAYTRLHSLDTSRIFRPRLFKEGVTIVASRAVVVLWKDGEPYLFTGAEVYNLTKGRPETPELLARVGEIAEVVEREGEEIQDVVVDGQVGFVSLGRRLWVVNVAHPKNIRILGRWEDGASDTDHGTPANETDTTKGNVEEQEGTVGLFGRMSLFRQILYITDWMTSRLHVIDVSILTSPYLVSSFGVPGEVFDIVISEHGKAAVTGYRSLLEMEMNSGQYTIVRRTVSVPDAHNILFAVAVNEVSGKIVAGTQEGRFMVFSAQVSPEEGLKETLSIPSVHSAVSGELVVAAGRSLVSVVRVANGQLELLDMLEVEKGLQCVRLHAGYAYVLANSADSRAQSHLQVIDVSNPYNAHRVANYSIRFTTTFVIVDGCIFTGSQVYDLTKDPKHPTLIATTFMPYFDPPPHPICVFVSGAFLYVVRFASPAVFVYSVLRSAGYRFVRLHDLGDVVVWSFSASGGVAVALLKDQKDLVVSFHVYHVVDGGLEAAGVRVPFKKGCSVVLYGSTAFVSGCRTEMWRVDVSDPSNPMILEADTFGVTTSFFIEPVTRYRENAFLLSGKFFLRLLQMEPPTIAPLLPQESNGTAAPSTAPLERLATSAYSSSSISPIIIAAYSATCVLVGGGAVYVFFHVRKHTKEAMRH